MPIMPANFPKEGIPLTETTKKKTEASTFFMGWASPGVPIFRVEATGPLRPKGTPPLPCGRRLDQECYLTFVCPLCDKRNIHGGYYKKPGKGDGHRCAHCFCWKPGGYYIREK